MNVKAFNVSARGFSHIKKEKECQDNSITYCDDVCSIAIVCDGHGGDDYIRSAIGSQYACNVALENIKEFVCDVDTYDINFDDKISCLEKSIICGWNEAVNSHVVQNPFSEDELISVSEKARHRYIVENKVESAYGTTLIAAAINENYWFGIQIGDGKCVIQMQ